TAQNADGIDLATGIIHQTESSAKCEVDTSYGARGRPAVWANTAAPFSRSRPRRAGGRVRAFAAGGMRGREARGVLLEQDACDSSSGRVTLGVHAPPAPVS